VHRGRGGGLPGLTPLNASSGTRPSDTPHHLLAGPSSAGLGPSRPRRTGLPGVRLPTAPRERPMARRLRKGCSTSLENLANDSSVRTMSTTTKTPPRSAIYARISLDAEGRARLTTNSKNSSMGGRFCTRVHRQDGRDTRMTDSTPGHLLVGLHPKRIPRMPIPRGGSPVEPAMLGSRSALEVAPGGAPVHGGCKDHAHDDKEDASIEDVPGRSPSQKTAKSK
jgi:hypothetical protein